MNRKTNIPSTARILRIEKALTPSSRAWLNHQPRPDRLFGRRVPDSLDGLTFGELLGLQEIEGTSNGDSIVIVARTVLKTRRPAAWILRTRADRVFGFLAFVTRELERIGKLFKAIEHTPDEDELAAGVNDLDFGPFGRELDHAEIALAEMIGADGDEVFDLHRCRGEVFPAVVQCDQPASHSGDAFHHEF